MLAMTKNLSHPGQGDAPRDERHVTGPFAPATSSGKPHALSPNEAPTAGVSALNCAEDAHADEPTGAVTAAGEALFLPIRRSYYPILLALFVTVFLVSNITATKGVEIGPLVTDGAFFLFPLAYVLGDVLSECYGFRPARTAIVTGFVAAVVAILSFYVAIALPPASFYENQQAFATVLGLVPQVVAASLAGYLVGQLLNAWVLVAMKRRTGERHLWARLLGSTVVGEFADTLLFCLIAAPVIGISTAGDAANYVIVGFLWKTLVEAAILPATYAVTGIVKRRERELAELSRR